ncbi:hypothetical protein V6N12_060200 [Hibiscus sabdariffa]|uniref:Uncharacterized protein n=1 Tax=Hibiscus sabdariffa TaxID=183260 RepID=A0ABR2D4I0_9ROSI
MSTKRSVLQNLAGKLKPVGTDKRQRLSTLVELAVSLLEIVQRQRPALVPKLANDMQHGPPGIRRIGGIGRTGTTTAGKHAAKSRRSQERGGEEGDGGGGSGG